MLGFTYNTTPYFYLRNLQGDVVGIHDAAGNVVATYDYDAWGNILDISGAMGYINPIRYRGYYCDNETGFYYCQSRYYNPQWCRWISADVYCDTQDGILGTNMYAYCQGDPVNLIDPSGMMSTTTTVDALYSIFTNAPDLYRKYKNWKFEKEVRDRLKFAEQAMKEYAKYGRAYDIFALPRDMGKKKYSNQELFAFAATTGYDKSKQMFSSMPIAFDWLVVVSPLPIQPDQIAQATAAISDYLGPAARVITNASGDKVFLSADGLRRVRFDIINYYPHSMSHSHVEELVNGIWIKSGPIYPK